MKRAMILIVAATLFGCGGEPRFDATDDASANASMELMMVGLSEDQKKEFLRSVMTLTLMPAMRETMKATFRGGPTPDPRLSTTTKPIHGMTVAEINAKAAAEKASKVGFPETPPRR